MEGEISFPAIKPINKSVIHRICSGQVILDLPSAVKELVENSLDAGASSIEVNLREYGEEYFKVSDNGSGISPSNFQVFQKIQSLAYKMLFHFVIYFSPKKFYFFFFLLFFGEDD